jgi:CO dehydrogenase maturation factor
MKPWRAWRTRQMTENRRPKFAVAGKGGVGKTTVSAGLVLALARRGEPVFAVDGDSNGCLGYALGFPGSQLRELKPLAEMREELEERAKPGDTGMYLLTPPVDDLIDKYSVTQDNMRLLVMGTIGEAGSGCACGLNTALREILRQLVKRPEALVVDMEAGVEHMGRGTTSALDTMIVVAEPAGSSLRTASRVVELARQMGVQHLAAVANKVRRESDVSTVQNAVGDVPIIATIPFLEGLREPLSAATPETDRLVSLLGEAIEQMPH